MATKRRRQYIEKPAALVIDDERGRGGRKITQRGLFGASMT
jgi:hypothetical protein